MSTKNPKNKTEVEKIIELPSADQPDLPKEQKYKSIISEAENDSYGRRHWKIHNEAIQNQEEDLLDIGPLNTVNLKRRTVDLQLDKMVGMRQQIIQTQKDVIKTNYFCELCQIACTDSITWLDHLNGKKHNRLLGMNMKVERIGVQTIKEKLNYLSNLKKQENDRKSMKLMIQKQQYDNDKDFTQEEKFQKKIKLNEQEEQEDENENSSPNIEDNKQDQQINENEQEIEEVDEEQQKLEIELAKYGLPTNFNQKKQ